jgi:hypothetical protein
LTAKGEGRDFLHPPIDNTQKLHCNKTQKLKPSRFDDVDFLDRFTIRFFSLITTIATNSSDQPINYRSIQNEYCTMSKNVFLVAAKRTPFGSFGGSLKGFSATDLGTHATKAALDSISLDPEAVDSIFFGNVIQSSADAAYLARHVGLRSGMKLSAPSLTINRLCGSGFETVILGAHSIQLGESNIAVCGGAENMSDAPLQVAGNDARWGVKLGTGLKMRDALWDGESTYYIQCECLVVGVFFLFDINIHGMDFTHCPILLVLFTFLFNHFRIDGFVCPDSNGSDGGKFGQKIWNFPGGVYCRVCH